MGRTFENRKHAMAKRGARDAKAFTRAGRLIAMAVKAGGPSPEGNPTLRRAIQNAKSVSMPKDKIQAAIDKASGQGDNDSYEPALYEGFGPHGVAIIVDAATDNPNLTCPGCAVVWFDPRARAKLSDAPRIDPTASYWA